MNGLLSDIVSCTYDSKKEKKKDLTDFFSVCSTANTSIEKGSVRTVF